MKTKGSVCVTGATGFLASWLIKRLLQDGYSVNATIWSSFSPACPGRNINYLIDLPGASERLQIFNAELDKPESFAPAIEGCIGLFHLAHSIDFQGKETEEVKIRKSVNGTIGILQACLNSKTVKRVVYISSALTVIVNNKDVVDETVWSDVDCIRENLGNPGLATYTLTKISAEKAALEFAEENGLELVTIIPPCVHGPFICPFLPESVDLSMALIFGHQESYSGLLRTCFVHTDDLARAHIFLFEHPNAKGRYICSAVDLTLEKLSECLSARYPEYQILTADSLKDIKGFATAGVSSKKLLDMGFNYNYGVEEMFDDAIECCKQKGFL